MITLLFSRVNHWHWHCMNYYAVRASGTWRLRRWREHGGFTSLSHHRRNHSFQSASDATSAKSHQGLDHHPVYVLIVSTWKWPVMDRSGRKALLAYFLCFCWFVLILSYVSFVCHHLSYLLKQVQALTFICFIWNKIWKYSNDMTILLASLSLWPNSELEMINFCNCEV